MTISLIVNGTTYFYPENGDTAWGPEATDWASAVTTGMLQKAGGLFQLLGEVDFGITYGLKSTYYKSRSANISSSGVLRLARADAVSWRNQANSADLDLSVNTSNELTFDGTAVGRFVTVSDTNSIDMTLSSGNLSADLILSAATADSGYQLVELAIKSDGLFAQSSKTFSSLTLTGASGVVIASAGVLSSESLLSSTRGGTGVNNSGTLTYGSNNLSFTTSGATSLTLPTSGTVLTNSNTIAVTNKTLGSTNTLTGATAGSFTNTGTVTLFTATDTVVGRQTTDTLQNKTMSGAANTFSNIGISSLTTVLADANKALVRDASGIVTSALIVNANVDAAAAITRSKLATGSANHVLINDGSGVISSEAQLAGTRGGTGASNAGVFSYGSNNITLTTTGATSLTIPTSGALLTDSSTNTVTNKTMSGSSNTFTNIGISSLATVLGDANKALVRDGSGVVTSALILNANIDAAAAIARTKIASGSANHVLINDGSGVMSSEALLAGTRGGTGVSNSGTFTYGSNNLTFTLSGTTGLTLPTSGTLITSSSPTIATPNITTDIKLTNQAALKLYEQTGNGTNYIGFTAPDAVTADITFKLPDGDGSNGQFLSTNGAGTLLWGSASGLVNPMTTAGDMIYGGISGAATRLPAPGAAGYMLASTSSTVNAFTQTPTLVGTSATLTVQAAGSSDLHSFQGFNATAGTGPNVTIARSKSGTVGTHAIVASGDNLGSYTFKGSNGTTFDNAAQIKAEVDGTPGASGDMPGRLVFSTTPDGSATLGERMRINSVGQVFIGTGTTTNASLNDATLAVTDINGNPAFKGYRPTATTSSVVFGLYSDVGGTATQNFRVNANGACVGTANSYTSDERAKKDIEPLKAGLADLLTVKPIQYRMKSDDEERLSYGFSAQQLEEVMPNLVMQEGIEDGEGGYYKAIYAQDMISILVKAVQELKAEIDALKARIGGVK